MKIAIFAILAINAFCLGFVEIRIAPDYEDANFVPYYYSEAWDDYLKISRFEGNFQGVVKDYEYCAKVKKFQKKYPLAKNIRTNRVVFSDFFFNTFVKDVLGEITRLVMFDHYFMSKKSEISEMRPDISLFFHQSPNWHENFKIGEQFLCENQYYNHIPGNRYLSYKDVTALKFSEYGNYYKNRENCFSPWKTMPFTLVLSDFPQCMAFLEVLKKDPTDWLYKKARESHNGEGVVLLTKETAEVLYKYYAEEGCPDNEPYIAQKYIKNPCLIHKKKFDIRVYMLIASMDPLIILYHDGFIRIAAEPYKSTSSSLEVILTNSQITENYLKQNSTSENYSQYGRDFKFLQWYLTENFEIPQEWMENYFRKTIKQTMLHLVRMNLSSLLRHPRVFELFGLDFLLDDQLHLWYLELNLTPSMVGSSAEKKKVNKKIVEEVIMMQFSKVFNEDFAKIMEKSQFEWVFDGRKRGLSRYHDLLNSTCI